ncbi:MAG TPA: hypothetical protein VGQ33_05625 [Vicinamibacteria bacterium]|nr:hypothetical protein [Vicinamibacteria bacterium]
MRIVALLVFVGCAAGAQAQPTRSFTPSNPPRADEETVLNARVVSVDAAGSRLTVRGVDVKADGGRDETYNVAAPSTSQLHEIKPGMEVLLTLRGTTVVGMKVSVVSGGAGGNVIEGTGPSARAASRARAKTAGTAPRPAVTPAPAAAPVPVAPVTGGVTGPTTGVVGVPVVGSTPAPVGATPFPTPRPVGVPVPVGDPPAVGTPTPVLLPSDMPSPASTPTPSPAP